VWLHEVVTDALLARRFPGVSRRLVNNPGARVSWRRLRPSWRKPHPIPSLRSQPASGRICRPICVPSSCTMATEAVRTRLLSRAPPYLFEEIRAAILAASVGVDREMSKPRDFAGAKRFVARLKSEGRLNEATLLDLAGQRKYEDCVVAWRSCRTPASRSFVR